MRKTNTNCVVVSATVDLVTVIRVRFHANPNDYRSITWPVKHPYWCTGYGTGRGGDHSIVVAYVEDEDDIRKQWPEASSIQVMDTDAPVYTFTSRLQPPDWFLPTLGARGIPAMEVDDLEVMTERWEAVVSVLGGMRGNKLVYHNDLSGRPAR